MKKSILCLLLALCLCLCVVFAGCKDDEETPETDEVGKKGEIKVSGSEESAEIDRPNKQLPDYTIGY